MIGVDALASSIPFLERLQPPSVATISRSVRVQTVAPRTILIQPGDTVSGVYFVSQGAIRVYYLDEDGREGTLYHIRTGESCVLALNSLFSAMPYPAWAEAGDEGVRCTVLDGATARQLLGQDENFLSSLFGQVSVQLYDLLRQLERAIRLPLEKRLAKLLIDLADQSGTIRLSHERIASHLGTSREVVSRILRSLASSGITESSYGEIRIVDTGALAGLSK